jgi:anti-anti-sigma factor
MNDADSLRIETYEQGDVPVVAAKGDVDLSTAHTLKEALEHSCQSREGTGTLAIDIREVTFIDSAGLALLVEVRKRFVDKCHLALIIAAGSQPERVLKLGRFDTFLRVCYTPEEVAAVPSAA